MAPQGKELAWEVLRMSFLSTLYRMWVYAHIARTPTLVGDVDQVEQRHRQRRDAGVTTASVANATVMAVRTAIRLDWRRACDGGASWVQRNGELGAAPAARKAMKRVKEVWCASGWAELLERDTRLEVRFRPFLGGSALAE
jgi:hypothetical protein